MDSTYSAKQSAELAEFVFGGMDVFGHKFDDINVYPVSFHMKYFWVGLCKYWGQNPINQIFESADLQIIPD